MLLSFKEHFDKGQAIGRAKCVRCPSGVVDGLRGKHKWPLLMALFFLSFFFLLVRLLFSQKGLT
jgi:hypothetical protein